MTGKLLPNQTKTFSALVTDDRGVSVNAELTIQLVPALTLELADTELICEPGGRATISWQVAGGVAPYEVRVGGGEPEARTSRIYECPQTAGTREVSLVATDAGVPEQRVSAVARIHVGTLSEILPGLCKAGVAVAEATTTQDSSMTASRC